MYKFSSLFLICFFMPLSVRASDNDSTRTGHRSLFSGLVHLASGMINSFNHYDTTYIEPQHYNFTFMMQNTTNFEIYRISTNSGQYLTLSPNLNNKLGPYFGWRFLFMGYTFDINHISVNTHNSVKKEFDVSLYTSMFGVDFFYRRTGSDYKIRSIYLDPDLNTQNLIDQDFPNINIGVTGLNVYYIFNHRHFSYPAAFSQSTCQKKSSGSFICGVSYTRHSIDLDYASLQQLIQAKCQPSSVALDSNLMFNSVKFLDVSVSLGYAYNWVFAKNWLLCASATPAIAYKYSSGELQNNNKDSKRNFSLKNFDFIGRLGIVWNNLRWYSGMSAIFNSYNYDNFKINSMNSFGSINVYLGFNFGIKKEYKKIKK
jgi:hypothetical protein